MNRDRLLELFKKTKQFIAKFPQITSVFFLIIVFSVVSVFAQGEKVENNVGTIEFNNPTPTVILNNQILTTKLISPTPTIHAIYPTLVPTIFPSPVSTNSVQTGETLLSVVNSFRSVNGVSSLNSSFSLCQIAEKRLNELVVEGNLDGHAGFNKFFSSQTEFNAMGEVIFQSSSRQSPEYAVNEGWAKSTAGHRENLLDPKWNFGCGATNGYFSVFNLGKK